MKIIITQLCGARFFFARMRFAERFLVVFAALSLGMRLAGMKDAPTMELIALPLLALYYLLLTAPLVSGGFKMLRSTAKPSQLAVAVIAGAGLSYCTISLTMFTLHWLPRLDMLENCSIILTTLTLSAAVLWRFRRERLYLEIVIRTGLLLLVILAMAVIPLPPIGGLSRGAF